MSYPPRWNEGYESDFDRSRRRRRSSEDPRWERERSESARRGRGRREDDESSFESQGGFAERERWEQYEDWQQPRRMGGYGEQNYAQENQRFGDWEQQRRYPESQRFGSESFRREGGRSRFGDFSDREQQRGFAGRGPKNYKRSDQRIQEDVCDRLTADPDVDASEIQVDVKNGEVTLEGSVAERGMKRCAEECIEDVGGVTQVHNRLRVAPSQGQQGQQASDTWGQQRGESQRADQPGTSQSRTGRIA